MKIIESSRGRGITVSAINTTKFKRNTVQLSFILPRNEDTVSCAAILSATLMRGCKRYGSVTAIGRALCGLYNAGLSIHSQPYGDILLFHVNSSMLDDKYAFDGGEIFGGVLELISELLLHPLTDGEALKYAYVESEKKRRVDMIRAEINNKDRYALIRADEIAFKGTPLAIRCTEEAVLAVTAESAYRLLLDMISTAPLMISVSGDITRDKERALDRFIELISEKRSDEITEFRGIHACVPEREIPETVMEKAVAKQGRMVLSYSMKKCGRGDAAPMIFDEIFGSSPVSRLFMNVRERLSLCYYCSSRASRVTGRMLVRSGLDLESRDMAIEEIERQLALLCDPENITDEELENAKLARISTFISMEDDPEGCLTWYQTSKLAGLEESNGELIEAIKAVTREAVSEVARSVRLQLSYFLDGNGEEPANDENEE